MAIEEGKKAPAFTLKDAKGKPHKLADYAGKHVIVYFYPRDDTPGCTKETCDFRDNLHSFFKNELSELQYDRGKSAMPSYRRTLTDAEIDDVVAYLTTLRGPS